MSKNPPASSQTLQVYLERAVSREQEPRFKEREEGETVSQSHNESCHKLIFWAAS